MKATFEERIAAIHCAVVAVVRQAMADSHTTEAIRTSGGVRVLREDLAAGAATATGRTMGITFPKPQQGEVLMAIGRAVSRGWAADATAGGLRS